MFNFNEFSKHLICSGDLDPDYIFINNVCKKLNWDNKQKADWIALKSIIYDSISELEFILDSKSFENVKYGTERRKHKRNSYVFYEAIKESSNPYGGFYEYFMSLPVDAGKAMKELQKIKGIGPWASWKIIDLVSCCLGKNFIFKNLDFRMAYEYPIRGMLLINNIDEKKFKKIDDDTYKKCIDRTYEILGDCLKLKAPPYGERKINKTNNKTIKGLICELPKQLMLWGQDLQVAF